MTDRKKARRGPALARRHPAKLADVARLAEVSLATASRALQKPELVAPATVHRVRSAAQQLTYVPNGIAGALSSRKSNVVVAVIPSTFNPVFTDLVESLRRELGRAGRQLFLGLTEYDVASEEQLVREVVAHRPCAIVLTGVVHSPATTALLTSQGIPVVETWDLAPDPIDMLVGFSNEKAGALAAEHLLSRGRRRLAMMIAHDPRAQTRRDGFIAAAARRGADPVAEVRVQAPSSLGAAREAFAKLLARGEPFDGVFCTSDQLALGAVQECLARGIAVPDRVAIVGFGNHPNSAHLSPSLTSVAVDGARIGREATRMILERLSGGHRPARAKDRILDVGCWVLVRQSA